MRYTIAWLLLAALCVILLARLNWLTYLNLVKYGIRTQGEVTEVLPEMHRTLRYRFRVAGQTYEGQYQSRMPNPAIEKLAPGSQVTVFYDSREPKKSVLGDPKAIFKQETVSIVGAALLFPTLIVLAWKCGIIRIPRKAIRFEK